MKSSTCLSIDVALMVTAMGSAVEMCLTTGQISTFFAIVGAVACITGIAVAFIGMKAHDAEKKEGNDTEVKL